MTTAKQSYEPQSKLSVVPSQKDWPTMYDLPSEYPEEDGLPDEFHDLQPQLLSETLQLTTVASDQVFTGTDLNLYYDRDNSGWHKRPDWFAVAGVPRLYDGTDLRMSYVIWDEQVIPFVIVELLSSNTAKSDLGETQREPDGTPTKWEVYEQILKVPNYVVFDRATDQLKVFKLAKGKYQEQDVNEGRVWLDDWEIGVGMWQGEYQGVSRSWLRWYDADGRWVPTEGEQLKREKQRAENERKQRKEAQRMAEQERSRAARLAERLRELGIDPDEV